MNARALVLFDIDGTLVRRAGPHHREALVEAVRAITGLDTTTENVPVHGMLDPDILTLMMRNAGASEELIRRQLPAIMERAQSIYVRRCPDLQDKTCPGVRRLLYAIKRRGIPTGLVTGNLTRIGWKKMERAGLRHYFHFGMFAEMAPDRTALARMAIERAHRRAWIQDGARVSLIGDAPSDIIAARENGARSIAVHTGISTREELAAHSPDMLLEDLRALKVAMLV
ncbi:MAG TPA: HAD family hydrolase [Bryobacteraceae bacterium]|nr:HAD family hydrolase [Bryobacteraceae bacterium]